jgi:hypothetical protein
MSKKTNKIGSSSTEQTKKYKRTERSQAKKGSKLQITAHIRRNTPFLHKFALCRSQKRCAQLLAGAGPEQLLCLVECCLNLLRHRQLPLRPCRLLRLRPYAAQIRTLSRARSASSARAHLLASNTQVGKGVPLIASLVVSTLLPLLIDKAIEAVAPSPKAKY